MPDVNREAGTVEVQTTRAAERAPKAVSTADALLLLQAKKRFRSSAEREAAMRARQLDDQQFRASNQWPLAVRAEREADGRPCITINRLPVFIRQVTNQQRQSKPAITINPVDSGSDPKTAEVLQGIIRHIEITSQADIAYDTACDHQVTIGRGFFRVIAEWNDANPWEQDIKIKRIRNPFTVYFDPACTEADYHDARYAFIVEDMPKDEFVALYGEEIARHAEMFASIGDRSPDWMPEGRVRVAEYYYVEETKEKISLLSNGSEQPTAVVKEPAFAQLLEESGITVVRARTITRRQVKWAKITGAAVLEQGDWPGKWIPIIPVLGDEIDLNGEVDLRGMVRDAKDPQRMYNYWVSAETETIALAPRSPFVGAAGQFEGYQDKWKLANRRNFPYLEYNPTDVAGTPIPPPQRNAIEPPIAAIVAATKQSDNDLKAVTGIYDASLGERGPQEAARAIMARQKQSDIANINWIDNLARSMRALGRILLDLIPHIYDTPRVMRVLGIDDKPKLVMVHAGNPGDAPQQEDLAEGIQGIYDLSVGRYDVTVTVGPSYQSKRQESVEAITAFIQAFPPAAPAVGDVLAENMDWPGAAVIAKRLRKMVPPQLLDDQDGQDQAQQLQQAQQKLQQAGQMVEMLTKHVSDMSEQIKTKQVEKAADGQIKQLELASRERIAAMQLHNQLLIAQITATKNAQLQTDGQMHEALLASLEGEQQARQADLDRQHEASLAYHESAHDQAMVAQQQGADQQTAQMGAAADQQTAQQGQMLDQQQAQQGQQHEAGLNVLDKVHEMAMADAQRQHEAGMAEQQRTHDAAMTAKQQAYDATAAKGQQAHELKVVKAKPKPKPAAKTR